MNLEMIIISSNKLTQFMFNSLMRINMVNFSPAIIYMRFYSVAFAKSATRFHIYFTHFPTNERVEKTRSHNKPGWIRDICETQASTDRSERRSGKHEIGLSIRAVQGSAASRQQRAQRSMNH